MISFDCETFLNDGTNYVPASLYLQGDKKNPVMISPEFQAHPDNVMAEIAPINPFHVDSFIDMVHRARQTLASAVPISVQIIPEALFSRQSLDADPESRTIGCDPDYLGPVKRGRVKVGDLGNSRYAGGHLHFDVNPKLKLPKFVSACLCDRYLGLWLVANGEKQGNRRKTYGLAGLFRPKSYGIEYRTPSNWWFGLDNDKLLSFSEQVRFVSEVLERGDVSIMEEAMTMYEQVKSAINNEDQDAARRIMYEF